MGGGVEGGVDSGMVKNLRNSLHSGTSLDLGCGPPAMLNLVGVIYALEGFLYPSKTYGFL